VAQIIKESGRMTNFRIHYGRRGGGATGVVEGTVFGGLTSGSPVGAGGAVNVEGWNAGLPVTGDLPRELGGGGTLERIGVIRFKVGGRETTGRREAVELPGVDVVLVTDGPIVGDVGRPAPLGRGVLTHLGNCFNSRDFSWFS
jgi:hypothetical protein